jgi:hypothetical protein
VNLIFEEANVNQEVYRNQSKSQSVPPFLDSNDLQFNINIQTNYSNSMESF